MLWARAGGRDETLTIASSRVHKGRPIVAFEGLESVEAVERFAGTELRIPEASLQALGSGWYYEYQLIGCTVKTVDGRIVGTVARVDSGPGGSRLVVPGNRGDILVPFVPQICVSVDLAEKGVRIDPPEGLLELNQTPEAGATRP